MKSRPSCRRRSRFGRSRKPRRSASSLQAAPGTRAAIEAAAQDLRQQVIIDPETRDIVFQAVDERTGEVVRQVPDEMLLRLRAYVREISAKQAAEAHAESRDHRVDASTDERRSQ